MVLSVGRWICLVSLTMWRGVCRTFVAKEPEYTCGLLAGN